MRGGAADQQGLVSVVSTADPLAHQQETVAAPPVHQRRERELGAELRGLRQVTERAPEPSAEVAVSRETSGHATGQRYCGCASCRRIALRANKRLKLRVARGEQIWIDANKVREHIEILREGGMGMTTIAEHAGVSSGAIVHICYDFANQKRTTRVTYEIGRRILSVRYDIRLLKPRRVIDATGPRRKLQALIVAGWSIPQLATLFGWDRQRMCRHLHMRRCSTATCIKINDLFERIWLVTPPPLSSHTASRNRAMIKRHGWVGIGAWDNETIDDPDATPMIESSLDEIVVDEELVCRALAGRVKLGALPEPERVELARQLQERGDTAARFAELTRCSTAVARRYLPPDLKNDAVDEVDEQRRTA